MATIGIVSDHWGQTAAALAVASSLQKLGHRVIFYLQEMGPAAQRYEARSKDVVDAFEGLGIEPIVMSLSAMEVTPWKSSYTPDCWLVMLSPSKQPNIEMLVAHRAQTSVYGYAEVPCGHNAPLWTAHARPIDRLAGMFVAKATEDLRVRFPNTLWEVGPRLSHLRGIDRQATGSAAKAALGMGVDDPWVWHSGGPYPEAVEVLRHVVEKMVSVKNCHPDRFRRLTLVVTRHGRDEQHERAKEIAQDYWAVMDAAASAGLTVIENSPGHGRPLPSPRYTNTSPVSHTSLFCALHYGGVLVTGHGTDGLNAPYCGYPSILCNASTAFDPDMLSEKGVNRFPLEDGCPHQVGMLDDLADALDAFLTFRPLRRLYAEFCEHHYPFPKQDAGELVADKLNDIVRNQ